MVMAAFAVVEVIRPLDPWISKGASDVVGLVHIFVILLHLTIDIPATASPYRLSPLTSS